MTCVIFDLDGVLVDSELYWQQAFAEVGNAWRVEHGRANPDLTAAGMARFQGGRVNDTMAAVLASVGYDALTDVERDAVTHRVITHASEAFAADPTPIAGSVAVARGLAEEGVRLAVASSSAQEFIDAALDASGLHDAVEVTQSALLLEHGKPHPEVYELALAHLGARAEDGVAIEDSTIGLVSALRAGLRVVWLLTDETETDVAAYDRLRAALAVSGADPGLIGRVVGITRELHRDDLPGLGSTVRAPQ